MAALRSLGLAVKQLRSRYRYTATGEQMIRAYVGGYEALHAMVPTIGADGTDGRIVVSWDLTEGESVNGKLEITEEKAIPDMGGSGSPADLGDPIYELDWAEERRPIEQHHKMPRLKADRPWYPKPWCSASDVDNKSYSGTLSPPSSESGLQQREWSHWTALDANDITGGTWTLAQYKSLVEKGIVDYPVAYPLASATTYHNYRPSSGTGVFSKENPPSECGAPTSSYVFVKTADRITKQGRLYTRVQQWRGYYGGTDDLLYL